MILTYRYRFVVLLHIHGFVTVYSKYIYKQPYRYSVMTCFVYEMKYIYMDKYICDDIMLELEYEYTLINEVPTEEAPLRFMDQDVFHH